MKAKYRIVKTQYEGDATYTVQKKSWLGFWYNPLNIDAYTTGIYDDIYDAKKAINRMLYKPTKKVIYEIEED